MLNEPTTTRTHRSDRRGFTLLELAVSLAIISVLLVAGSVAFTSIQRNRSVAQARNAIVSYAGIARSYAIANQIETMLVINPYNGRFEIWHLNPPVNGGPWDPVSGGTAPPFSDGYAFAPVLDSDASLPTDGSGEPLVYVNPIDFQERYNAPITNAVQKFDNLIWTALCFDETGALVVRSRRIATQTGVGLDGGLVPVTRQNRLRSNDDTSVKQAQAPNLMLLDPTMPGVVVPALVTSADSLITSARGFVITERRVLESGGYGKSFTAANLANPTDNTALLMRTLPGGEFEQYSQRVLLDRYSAEPLNIGDE